MTKIGLDFTKPMFLPFHHPVLKMPICFYFYCCHNPKREEARLTLPFRTETSNKQSKQKMFLVFSHWLLQRKKQNCLRTKRLPKYVTKNCCPNSIFLKDMYRKYSTIFFKLCKSCFPNDFVF